MIVTKNENGFVTTYSDKGFKIHGGNPVGDYDSATDIVGSTNTYTETDIPADCKVADAEEAEIADYKEALAEFGVTE